MATTVDDETILEVLRSNDAPRMTTTEIAGQLPVTRGTTRSRLQRLVDDDLLDRKREGNNVLWWLPERSDELDEWEADQSSEADEPDEGEAAATTEEPDEVDTEEVDGNEASVADDADTDEGEADEETTVEIEATEPAKTPADEDGTAVEVEAVEEDDEIEVTTPDEETETRTATERPELSADEEGLRAVAIVAATLVVVLLLRQILSGSEEPE